MCFGDFHKRNFDCTIHNFNVQFLKNGFCYRTDSKSKETPPLYRRFKLKTDKETQTGRKKLLYGRLRLIRSVLRASKFSMLKLTEIVN